jgi:hypothetical protein
MLGSEGFRSAFLRDCFAFRHRLGHADAVQDLRAAVGVCDNKRYREQWRAELRAFLEATGEVNAPGVK